jgi:hypothetical protein
MAAHPLHSAVKVTAFDQVDQLDFLRARPQGARLG